MGVRLSVQRAAWLEHVAGVAAHIPDLVPVVKGNGYGFSRPTLMPIAAEHTRAGGQIAVGTVYEVHDVPTDRVALVLTPHVDRLPAELARGAVLTVGDTEHVAALHDQGWPGPLAIKLASSMHRHGTAPRHLTALVAAITASGSAVDSYVIHLPLAGGEGDRVAEIVGWLPHLDPTLPISVSHLSPETYRRLRTAHPAFAWRMRIGTALWHGDKRPFQLTADVIGIEPAEGGSTAGYRASTVPSDGHIVLVAAGSAHGIRALEGGRSPFHFSRHRVAMLEPPHMHTTMLFVPRGEPLPTIGDRLDVQHPLIATTIDELEWLDD